MTVVGPTTGARSPSVSAPANRRPDPEAVHAERDPRPTCWPVTKDSHRRRAKPVAPASMASSICGDRRGSAPPGRPSASAKSVRTDPATPWTSADGGVHRHRPLVRVCTITPRRSPGREPEIRLPPDGTPFNSQSITDAQNSCRCAHRGAPMARSTDDQRCRRRIGHTLVRDRPITTTSAGARAEEGAAEVVAVGHDDGPNQSRRDSPRGLPGELPVPVAY